MDRLVINDQLTSTIIDDQSSNTTSAIRESALDLAEETIVVNDGKALLDITRLSHADKVAVITDVEDAVLLKDWSTHALDIDRRFWVGVEAALLLQFLGEEIDTKVAILTSLRRHADANDLARTTLKDDKIANADEVAGDGHGPGRVAAVAWLHESDLLSLATSNSARAIVLDSDIDFSAITTMVMVMMVVVVERMGNSFSNTLRASTEAVVLTLVVVVTHVSVT